MPMTRENVHAHEWIGLQVTIKDSRDPRLKGLTGLIRDETKNTFTIQVQNRMMKIPKSLTTFLATFPEQETVTVDGDLLRHRPEDRVKKGLPKW